MTRDHAVNQGVSEKRTSVFSQPSLSKQRLIRKEKGPMLSMLSAAGGHSSSLSYYKLSGSGVRLTLSYPRANDCSVCRAGGPWLITDMRRGETIFDIDPHLQVRPCRVLPSVSACSSSLRWRGVRMKTDSVFLMFFICLRLLFVKNKDGVDVYSQEEEL